MSVGARINKRRTAMKLSMRALGKKCGVSGSAIQQWESDKTSPDGENLMTVAKALETTAEWIMTGESKAAIAASDRKFSNFIDENLKYLNEEQRKDIETLINVAVIREKIIKKYE